MRPTEILSAEHRVIEQVLDCLEKMAIQALELGTLDFVNARDAVRFLKTFADRCHHGKEEDRLFPLLAQRGIPAQVGPIAVMLDEHEVGRGFVRGMASALEATGEVGVRRFAAAARSFVELLRAHIAKEDNILFPMGEACLSDLDRARLLESFDQAESEEIGAGIHEEMIQIADRLAAHYGVQRAVERKGAVLTGCCHHARGTSCE